jgi:hypothetical protein
MIPPMKSLFLLAFASLLSFSKAATQELNISSGENNVPLLQLFTSEGCSSCPPAEEWFSRLGQNPELWKQFVPVSFHVDYWNYLGWTDPYSSRKWSDLQRGYARLQNARSLYTPEFFLNGREWRIGSGISQLQKPGPLSLQIHPNGTVDATFIPLEKSSDEVILTLVPLAYGITQKIPSGENAGRSLRHDFVALAIFQLAMASDTHGRFAGRVIIPAEICSRMQAVSVWVSFGNDPTPIQSTGGWVK